MVTNFPFKAEKALIYVRQHGEIKEDKGIFGPQKYNF
jgi:hypothetical protein